MEKQPYVVCFHDDGHIESATLEEYRAQLDHFKFSTDGESGFYCLTSVEAVNKETAVAIAVVDRLNDEDCIGKLLKAYLEDFSHEWSLDSTDDVGPAEAKDLDHMLSAFSRGDRESVFDGLIELIKPCRWNPDKAESDWVDPREKRPEYIEVATTPKGRHRAWCRHEDDIPNGWIKASDLPSVGQLSLI